MTTVLTTDRLTLRWVEDRDREALLTHLNDFEIVSNLISVPYPYGAADAEDWLARMADNKTRGDGFHAAITIDDVMIGCITLRSSTKRSGWYELGYWLARSHWGQGLMSEAAFAMRDHAFNALGAEGLSAGALVDNDRSWAILMKLGFTKTGTKGEFSKAAGRMVASNRCLLTREAWEAKE